MDTQFKLGGLARNFAQKPKGNDRMNFMAQQGPKTKEIGISEVLMNKQKVKEVGVTLTPQASESNLTTI